MHDPATPGAAWLYHGAMSPASGQHPIRRALLRLLAAVTAAYVALVVVVRPSNQREWSSDQDRMASADFSGDFVRVSNLRNALYRSSSDFDVRWEERRYDLRRLVSVWYVVEPFADWRGPAHTFLSFGFDDGRYVAISVEVRKERGEAFSPLRGLLRQFELAYIVGDERDLIGLRANHRHDDVYLYPMRATPAQARALFSAMLQRANALAAQPEFYNTLTNTCTSNIVSHINVLAPGRIPFSYRTLLPAYSDDLAHELGLIDTALPMATYRAAYRINERAAQHADQEDFSAAIRAGLPVGTGTPG